MKKPFNSAQTRGRPLRDARLTAINFVADAVNRALDLREVADNALHAVLAVMKLDAGAVYVLQENNRELQLFAWRGLSEAFARQVGRIRRGDDATIDAVLDGSPQVTEDFQLSRRVSPAGPARAGFKSSVLLPIRAQRFVVGLLVLGAYFQRAFDDDELELIEVIANQLGNAMVNAQLQADLRASEEQYRALVENSDDAIYLADLDGRPRFANPAFDRIFGHRAEELAALGPFARVHPDDLPTVQAAFA
ncbi:GAF domain-containing protein, partial [bacterium]|nr:GAF domain-containing protein [bacterium]